MESTNQIPQEFIELLLNLGYSKQDRTTNKPKFEHISYYAKTIEKSNNWLDNEKHIVMHSSKTNKYRLYCFTMANIADGKYIYDTGEITIDKLEDLAHLLLLIQY